MAYPSPMTRFRRLGMPLVAGACLIAGVAVGLAIPRAPDKASSSSATRRLDRVTSPPKFRDVYSPDIRHDPYVVREQLRIVEMLARQCRIDPKYCGLAKSSREALPKD